MITAKVIEDSISMDGVRLISWSCTFPKFILAELNTHRLLSRSAASARAIPIKKFIQRVEENPVMFVHWGKQQAGMQAQEELSPEAKAEAIAIWKEAAADAAKHAKRLDALGLAKQCTNRVVETYSYVDSIITSTLDENFFNLRRDKDAQPEFQALANCMWNAKQASTPKVLKFGEWHLPFVTDEERVHHPIATLLALSAARCSRVSYLNHEKKVDFEKDFASHNKLLTDGHMSPLEHQATPVSADVRAGNFVGWLQYRKTLPREAVWVRKIA